MVVGLAVVAALLGGCVGSETEPSDAASRSTATPRTTAPAPAPTPTATLAPTESVAPVVEKAVPVRLAIPSLDITATVVPVTTVDRVLQIPPEPWVVGWWSDGTGPGTGVGTVVLTAHVDSRTYGVGPFVRATQLTPGGTAVLTDARGVEHTYVVDTVQLYEKTVLPYESLFSQQSPERVVFVTCGGTYLGADQGGYASNVVVTFVPA